MEAVTWLFSLLCLIIGLILFFKPAVSWLFFITKKRSKFEARYKQTTLWKELIKVIDNGSVDLKNNFEAIKDRFESYEEVRKAIRNAGLDSCNLIIGIDFTASNEWQGRKTFDHRSLHYIAKNSKLYNPYQRVILAMTKTLSAFDEDNLIPVYGFGDKRTKDASVFPFCEDGPCKGFEDVMKRYNEIVQYVELSGPTSFAPLIRKAIEITQSKGGYHILLIIADGQVTDEHDRCTRDAIIEASSYPLSIILVGVGDGPWNVMSEYDEKLTARKFDNFQFVDYHKVTKKAKHQGTAFALNALMEIPDQYKAIKNAGLL